MTPQRHAGRPSPEPIDRSGWSLIELLMAITVGSILMIGAARVLNGLMEAQSRAGERMNQAAARSRFAESFRTDAHQASEIVIEAATDRVCSMILLDGSTVRYESASNGVTRQTTRAGEPASRADLFRIGARSRFENFEGGHIVSAVLDSRTSEQPGSSSSPADAEGRVDAAVGLLSMAPSVLTKTAPEDSP